MNVPLPKTTSKRLASGESGERSWTLDLVTTPYAVGLGVVVEEPHLLYSLYENEPIYTVTARAGCRELVLSIYEKVAA